MRYKPFFLFWVECAPMIFLPNLRDIFLIRTLSTNLSYKISHGMNGTDWFQFTSLHLYFTIIVRKVSNSREWHCCSIPVGFFFGIRPKNIHQIYKLWREVLATKTLFLVHVRLCVVDRLVTSGREAPPSSFLNKRIFSVWEASRPAGPGHAF